MENRDMGTAVKGRRIIDAVDEVVAELRLANQIEALKLGTSALDDVDVSKLKQPATVVRQRRLNKLRAAIRVGLDVEEAGDE
jgi:hypothetical protein